MSEGKVHEVVISGIAGLYPECDDVDELWERLINKEDMVTIDSRRWVPGEFDVPPGTGKIKNPEKFDMTFFGIHRKLCEKMDPYTRLLCEQAYRCVCDAGVNPKLLDGSNTAVVMSSFATEPEHDMGASERHQGSYNVLAFSRTMQANRISYFLNVKGPSFQIDCSGCGGVQAIQYACHLIDSGMCTAAIVGSCSLLNKPEPSFHYQVMGRLSEDSLTRSFSSDANGYARSESCVSMFLQRKSDAKRIYGTILAAEVLCHGSKENAFSEFPVGRYETFLTDIYRKANVDPKDVCYFEACGAASKTLDALELNSMSAAMLKGRKKPLLIGSVKSNLGHTEGCSSMVSLTKVLLALNRGIITPNINYNEPNPDVPDLVAGRLQVVTEPTHLSGEIVGIGELSVTGICSHMIIKRNEKVKPVDKSENVTEKRLPRLTIMSGRSEEVLGQNLKKLESIGVDEEFALLANALYKDGIKPHVYRGFTVITDTPNRYNMIAPAPSGEKRPVWFMYSGMGSQWPTMGKTLLELPIFAKAIQRCHETLLPKGVNVLEIITSDDPKMFDNILHAFVGIAAVQIGLTDVIKAVGLQPDGLIGHSVGELGCAYADGCFTLEQMILAAHARGKASIDSPLIKGMMAAVGVGYNTIKTQLPEPIEVACHNSKDSCTLSGPAEEMSAYIDQLKAKGLFAKLVNVANIAYHSRYIKPAAPALLKYLKEIIPEPKTRSSKWVSSSIKQADWNSDLAKYSSAEYHTNNLLSSVLFEEASALIPKNAIVIEIAPHGLLQAIVKRSLPQASHIPLTNKSDQNSLLYLLEALGKMYLHGIPINLQALYPNFCLPAARGTPSISPLIDWLRDENFSIKRAYNDPDAPSPLCRFVSILRGNKTYEALSPHKIYKRIILPLNFYLSNIIDMFTNIGNTSSVPIVIEELNITGRAELSRNFPTDIRFQVMRGTGLITVNDTEKGRILCLGKINMCDEASVKNLTVTSTAADSNSISRDEILNFMKSMGIEREPSLSVLNDVRITDGKVTGTAYWKNNIGEFLVIILSLVEFYETMTNNVLKLFHQAREMKINLPQLVTTHPQNFLVEYDILTKTLKCDGIQISSIRCEHPNLELSSDNEFFVSFDIPQFIPYNNSTPLQFNDFLTICTQLVIENTQCSFGMIIKVIEIGSETVLHNALGDITSSPKYLGNTQITSYSTESEFLQLSSSILLQKDVWLIFAKPPSEEVLKSLTVVNDTFVLAPKSNKTMLENYHTKVIFESLVDKEWYTLYSVKRQYKKNEYEIVNFDKNYLSQLENQLLIAGENKQNQSKAVKTVILWGEVDSMITVDNILEETKNLPNNQFLHYWLFMGCSPVFEPNDPSFQNQIEVDVKMNILVNGMWGSLRFLPCKVNEVEDSVLPSQFLYPLSSVNYTEKICALGLNLLDDLSDNSNNSLGVYDYVTPTCMGVGIYDPHFKLFVPDKLLKWSTLNNWSCEDAATVPLLYSMASYIINHVNNCEFSNDNTIMINRALLPLSQALIALALYENLTIYTSVYGEEEKDTLLKWFPALKSEYIFDCSTNTFFADVRKKTRGVYKVINNFDDSQMVATCTECVKPLGVLVYVNNAVMNDVTKMRMRKFDIEIVARGVSSDVLIKSEDHIKIQIKSNLKAALEKLAVKPIYSKRALPPNTINTVAVQYLKKTTDKVVVKMDDSADSEENKVISKDERRNHIIIEGKIQTDLTLDVLEWLLKRGSRKVIIFMKQSHPFEATSLRLQSLRDQYRWAEIDVKPLNHLSSKSNIDRFMEEYPAPGPAMMFFLGSGLKEKIEIFDEVLSEKVPSCNMICIGKGGENICEKRKKRSLPSLLIRCSTTTLECINISHYLDVLIKESSKVPLVLVNKYLVHSRSLQGLMADLKHIPDNTTELHELFNQCTLHASFVEIPTSGPTKNHNRELYPVFLIPGLRPNRLHQLASQLFCPAMEARFPFNISSIDQIATDLARGLLSMPQNMFTIVADDWGGILALHIAAKLEAESKIVALILINAAPAPTIKWASELLKNEIAVVGKYFDVPGEIKYNMNNLSWDDKVKLTLQSSALNEDEEILNTKCLQLLHNRLTSLVSSKLPQKKIKNKCHLLEIPSQTNEDYGLREYLRKEPIVHMKDAHSAADLIAFHSANDVNTLNLFEYKDAANPPIEEYLGFNTIKKPDWLSSLLFRVRD